MVERIVQCETEAEAKLLSALDTATAEIARLTAERDDAAALLLKYGFEVHDGETLFDALYDMVLALQAAEQKLEAAEQALRSIAEGNLGDWPGQANYERIRVVCRRALSGQTEKQGREADG